ncbi:unnamed protein product [Prunus armeniaca]|uniref:Uncharacterized protein n=1 Tax=Prunus armeniaca TaxID=36596 RepID=A0A6J5ULF4_PRUAR|nr:unnamed protein product [Prunus armeniaca]
MPLILLVNQLLKFDRVPLNGLPSEFNTFRCVMRCQESMLSFKEFHCQLLVEEIIIEYSGHACYGGSDDIAALADVVMPPL